MPSMPITANTLYRDSFNFFRNQVASIVLLALLTAFISVLLNQAFSPDIEQLKILTATESDLASTPVPAWGSGNHSANDA